MRGRSGTRCPASRKAALLRMASRPGPGFLSFLFHVRGFVRPEGRAWRNVDKRRRAE